jgi:hypothetical protein
MATLNDLGKKVKAKYPGQYDDMSDIELGRRTKAKYPQDYADFSGAAPELVMVSAHSRNRPRVRPKEPAFLEPLVQGGSMAGGVTGRMLGGTGGGVMGAISGAPAAGIGAVPGATVGAVAGQELGGVGGAMLAGGVLEAVRQAVDAAMGTDNAPANLGEALTRIGDQALKQGTYESAGGVLSTGARLGGGALMGAARSLTPEAAQAAIREGITMTRGGMQRLGQRLGEYGAAKFSALRQATASGNQVNANQFMAAVQKNLDEMFTHNQYGDPAASRLPEAGEMKAKFDQLTNTFMADNRKNPMMTPLEVQKIVDKADAISKPLRRILEAGGKLTGTENAELLWYKEQADQGRAYLRASVPDQIIKGRPVSYEEINKAAQDLIKLKGEAFPDIKKAPGVGAKIVARVGPSAVGAGVGAVLPGNRMRNAAEGAAVGAAGGVALSPEMLSRLALMLNSPALAATLRQVPRGIGAIAQ